MRVVISTCMVCFGLACLSACQQPAGLPKEFGQAAQVIATSVGDQTAWKEVTASLDGQVIEPGVEGYAGVIYVAGGKLRGFSGRVGLDAAGEGAGPLTDEGRAAVLDAIETDAEYRAFLLKLIGQFQSPPNASTNGTP